MCHKTQVFGNEPDVNRDTVEFLSDLSARTRSFISRSFIFSENDSFTSCDCHFDPADLLDLERIPKSCTHRAQRQPPVTGITEMKSEKLLSAVRKSPGSHRRTPHAKSKKSRG